MTDNRFKHNCRIGWLLLILLVFTGCHQRKRQVTRSIYYWKTNFNTRGIIDERLNALECKTICLRSFDVDWDAAARKPKPVAVVQLSRVPDTGYSFVPVVFITQPAVRNITIPEVPVLAENINRLLQQLFAAKKMTIPEVQIDCDWTAGTREIYFLLLEKLRLQPFFKERKLSCTIRLHQIKYSLKAGVPPVDKGLLMCYNLGDLKKPGDHNSILDVDLVKDYLAGVKQYPLKLDVALPLFGWCVQFRNGKLKGILRDVFREDVEGAAFFKPSSGRLFTAGIDTVWHGYSFIRGDEVRVEVPLLEDIQAVARFTAQQIRNDTLSVILFHADSLTLNKYSNDDLKAIYNAYY